MSDSDALAGMLVAEHGAVYGYGLAGAVLATSGGSAPAVTLAITGLDTHRNRRDKLIQQIEVLGGTPPPGEAAYGYQRPSGAGAALRLIADIEDSVASACHAALGLLDDGALRTEAAGYLSDAAVSAARALLLSGASPARATTAFPGA